MDDLLNQFINSEICSDVSFLVGSEKELIYGHKFMFAINSEVFKKMFYGDLSETKMPIEIPDISPIGFLNMMKYMYTKRIDFELHHLHDVYQASNKYLVNNLDDKIMEYANSKLDKSNACLIFDQLTKMDENHKSLDDIKKIIVSNSESAFKSDYFKEISELTLIELLNFDWLTINEADILKSCVKWVNNQILKREIEPTTENKIKIFEPIKHYILFLEINSEHLKNFEDIDNLFSVDEIGLILLHLHFSNKKKPFPIECKTTRKHLKKVQSISHYNYNGYTGNFNGSNLSVIINLNYEIIIASIELKTNLPNLHFTIYENNAILDLKFNYLIDGSGKSCIDFLSKFAFKQSTEYKLVFNFSCIYISNDIFSDLSDLQFDDHVSGNKIVFKFTSNEFNIHPIHCINFYINRLNKI